MLNSLKNIATFSVEELTFNQLESAILDEANNSLTYTPCSATSLSSFGFKPDSPMLWLENNNFAICFISAEKKIPAQVLKKEQDRLIADLEKLLEDENAEIQEQPVGLKHQAMLNLAEKAFVVESNVTLYYHSKDNRLVCDNPVVAGMCVSWLRKALGSIKTTTLHVDGVSNSLGKNLLDCINAECDLSLGRFGYDSKLNLKGPEKETANFTQEYVLDHIKELLTADYQVTMVRLSSQGLSFDLTSELKIKNIKFEDNFINPIEESEFEDDSAYLLAVRSFELDQISRLVTDLVDILEKKAKEYK